MIIFHDSIGYQSLDEAFAQGRFKEYFVTGPGREPLYSLVMSLSITTASWFKFDYLALQILIQIIILLVSQWLTFRLLEKFRISDGACALILLYMGFSPALTSSGLILFSEIITYPLVLWLVLALINAFSNMAKASLPQNIISGLSVAVPALLLAFTKAAFELIVPILLIPFIASACLFWRRKETQMGARVLAFVVTVIAGLQVPLIGYKMLNRHYNGVFSLTDRAPEALYGNTLLRMEPLNGERIQTALAYMTGPDICSKIFANRCLSWGFLKSDVIGAEKTAVLREKGMTRQQINKFCITESIPYILGNPLQYIFLAVIEAGKILFWEAPELSYIVYPDAIDKTYNSLWLKYPLRFILALLSLGAFCSAGQRLWIIRGKIIAASSENTQEHIATLFVFLLILTFTAAHSAFLILPRYALPVAPLFLVLIAWSFDTFLIKRQ